MLNAFLVIFEPIVINPLIPGGITVRKTLLDFLDTRSEIKNWITVTSASFLVASDNNATSISAILHQKFPTLLFLVTKVESKNSNGWLNENIWRFINSPKSSGKWPEIPFPPFNAEPRLPP